MRVLGFGVWGLVREENVGEEEVEEKEEEVEQDEEREEAEPLRVCVNRRWNVDGEREGGYEGYGEG